TYPLNGKKQYYKSKDTLQKCFSYYNSFGRDKSGHWKTPKTEKLENLHAVCRDCVAQFIR
ncbi:MAG: hypothetical protein N2748_02555, partial [candidate division WOR-3 bacterium]|nr:hypothetical protein [candidate division WOR-3 bacterium]